MFADVRRYEEALLRAVADKKGPLEAEALRVPLLSTLEFFAFIVNREYLSDLTLVGFFTELITTWHESDTILTAREREDEKLYPEFKRLYRRLTDPLGPAS